MVFIQLDHIYLIKTQGMSVSKGTHFTTRTYYKLIQNTKLVQTTNNI